jgi:hypothetical protein
MAASAYIVSRTVTGRYHRGKIELPRKVKLAEGTLVKVIIPENGKVAKQRKKSKRRDAPAPVGFEHSSSVTCNVTSCLISYPSIVILTSFLILFVSQKLHAFTK